MIDYVFENEKVVVNTNGFYFSLYKELIPFLKVIQC